MTLSEYLQAKRKLCEAASKPEHWKPRPTGMVPERMSGLDVVSSHNRTPYMHKDDAEFAYAARTDFPKLIEALERAHHAMTSATALHEAEHHEIAAPGMADMLYKALADIERILEVKDE